MTTPKHTPGPWRWVDPPEGQDEGPLARLVAADGTEVLNFDPSCGWPPDDANARLICAAPDLLAACEAALPEFDRLHACEARADDGYSRRLRFLRETLLKLKNAVTKATAPEAAR
jgi:hypothetical protein